MAIITWASTLEIEHDAKYPSQYHSTRCFQVALHDPHTTKALGVSAGGSDRHRTCMCCAVPGTIQTSYRLRPLIWCGTEHCVRGTHVVAARYGIPISPCPSATDIGYVGGMAERATILTLLPPSPGPASSPLSCRDADEGGDMQPHEPHLSHLSSLWHLSHTRSTRTDVTTITTTIRCALPIVGQQPSVSRQNESQLSSRLIMSLLTKTNSGISDVDKRDLSDAWNDDEATTP
ncbi:hypothetical protein GE21DRAFT_1309502 [Neurospora crassa]|nr:hypothetical protein GE21DRAFT_1309502 [Neurospora crassa]